MVISGGGLIVVIVPGSPCGAEFDSITKSSRFSLSLPLDIESDTADLLRGPERLLANHRDQKGPGLMEIRPFHPSGAAAPAGSSLPRCVGPWPAKNGWRRIAGKNPDHGRNSLEVQWPGQHLRRRERNMAGGGAAPRDWPRFPRRCALPKRNALGLGGEWFSWPGPAARSRSVTPGLPADWPREIPSETREREWSTDAASDVVRSRERRRGEA